MNIKTFGYCILSLLIFDVAFGIPQEDSISFSKNPSKSTTKKNSKTKSKEVSKYDVGIRAASTCYNCDCQCDSYGWTDKRNQFFGNCVM